MNISTSSMPDINSDQFMMNRPAPSSQSNINVNDSKFARLVNDSEKSFSRTDNKRDVHVRTQDKLRSESETIKHYHDVKAGLSERKANTGRESEDASSEQQVSKYDVSRDDSNRVRRESGEHNEEATDSKVKKSDLADAEVKGDPIEDIDNVNKDTGGETAQIAGTVTASLEEGLSTDNTVPDQVEDQIVSTMSNSDQAGPSEVTTDDNTSNPSNNASLKEGLSTDNTVSDQVEDQIVSTMSNSDQAGPSEITTDDDTSNPSGNASSASQKGETSVKYETRIIDINTDSVAASAKQQDNNVIDRSQINNDSKQAVMNQQLDALSAGELNAEDGQSAETGPDGKTFNQGAETRDIKETTEKLDLNEEPKEKSGLSLSGVLPEKYVKKTATDHSDHKTVQSQIHHVTPEVLEELHNVKTLQDGLLSGNTQTPVLNAGVNNIIQGVSDTSLKSLESLNTDTTINSVEQAHSQAVIMSGKEGSGLTHGNAARTAGFSELLSQVVYVAKGKNKLDVTVNHDEFGKLKINISMDKGIMNIHVHASEKVVREFLESNIQSIVESLSKDGVSVGGFSVALKERQDNPENKFIMDSGLNRDYENIAAAAVHSARGLVNVFA